MHESIFLVGKDGYLHLLLRKINAVSIILLRFLPIFLLANPALIDYGTLLQNIRDLKDGKPIKIPVYDFKLSCHTSYRFDF